MPDKREVGSSTLPRPILRPNPRGELRARGDFVVMPKVCARSLRPLAANRPRVLFEQLHALERLRRPRAVSVERERGLFAWS